MNYTGRDGIQDIRSRLGAAETDADDHEARLISIEAAILALGGGSSAGAPVYLWCEESAGLNANSYEWSWGNGATGNDIGIPMMKAANLTHISFNADVFGTSVQINARKATTPGSGSIVANPLFTSNNSVFELPVPILFNQGDTLVVQTGALIGSTSDARACFRFEEV